MDPDFNPYQVTPQASTWQDPKSQDMKFYVVSTRKLVILYFATFGLYTVFWFYQNWQLYKTRTNDSSIWSVPRAIFYIFFTHTLFRAVEYTIDSEGRDYRWDAGGTATLFVVITLLERVCDRIPSTFADIAGIALFVVKVLPLMNAQKAINAACAPLPEQSNNKFTAANYVWIALGGLLWIVVLIGLSTHE